MRILHFFKTYWPDTFGGVERTIHALAEGGRHYGLHADVLTLSRSPSPVPLTFGTHRVFQVKSNLDVASTPMSLGAFRTFADLCRTADIVHYHFPWPFMDVVDLLTPHGKPTVVTYHSDIVKQQRLLKPYKVLMHRFLAGTDRIVATSPNYLASSPVLKRHTQNTTVIPIGLDQAAYPSVDPDRLAGWNARFPEGFFLFVGVLRYYKGIQFLIEAAMRTGLPVVLVGQGGVEDEIRAHIKTAAASNIHLVGAVCDADKVALLTLCRALVFPSHLRSEAFGLSLVEAAMHGKAMISCEIGTGTSFVNVADKTGLVIPPANSTALAEAMQHLWQNVDKCESFGRNAYARYSDLFTAQQMVKAYAELYQDIYKR